MIQSFSDAPDVDTNEIIVFGKGYGESIALHRRGAWFIVDSFYDESSGTRLPIARRYLDDLGVPPDVVKVIVATHWHDDHTPGIVDLYRKYASSKFACADAMTTQEFVALAESAGVTYSGSLKNARLTEWRKLLADQDWPLRSLPVSAGTSIWRSASDDFEMYALTPSGAESFQMKKALAGMLPQSGAQQLPPVRRGLPNHAAIVIVVRFGELCALLGSDLEISHIPGCGWQGALAQFGSQIPSWQSALFKVPHHGSETAHDPMIWTQALVNKPMSTLTPFIRGDVRLPKSSDVLRLKALSDSLLQASVQGVQRKTANATAQTVLNRAGIRVERYRPSLGAVRLRWLDDGDDINVDIFGSAAQR